MVKGEDGVGGGEVLVYGFWRLVGQSRRSWVNVVDGSRRGPFFFFFFFSSWFVGCGVCDQRRARMVVTSLGGVTGFSIGLGMKNSWGAAGYTRIAGAGLGLLKISWGKYLKGSVILAGLLF